MLKGTHCSSRGPGFKSQHPHGGSQLSVTPVPVDLIPQHMHPCSQNTNVHKRKDIYFKLTRIAAFSYSREIFPTFWDSRKCYKSLQCRHTQLDLSSLSPIQSRGAEMASWMWQSLWFVMKNWRRGQGRDGFHQPGIWIFLWWWILACHPHEHIKKKIPLGGKD